MSDVDAEIFRLLRESPKHYSELKKIIVVEKRICANQTLSNHLSKLVNEDHISRKILPNRRTIYEIKPEYKRRISNIEDLSKLKSLVEHIPYRIIDENLGMEEIKVKKRLWIEELIRSISYFKHTPLLRFALYFDKDIIKTLKYFLKIEDIAKEFRDNIDSHFKEIQKTIPPTIDIDISEEFKILSDWNMSLAHYEKIAQKHNFQFLLYSWYDGKSYSESILRALKTLNTLKKGHEDYIIFLNEISKKCYYSWIAYITEADLFEVLFSQIIDRLPLEKIGETCFIGILFGWFSQEYNILALDAALVSDVIYKKYNDVPIFEELGVTKKDKIPYNLINSEFFIKMKYDLLSDEVKYLFIKKGIEITKSLLKPKSITDPNHYNPLFNYIPFRKSPEITIKNIKDNIDFYDEELKLRNIEELEIEMNQYNILFNFKYNWKNKIIDLNDNPIVKEFKSFLNDTNKRKWLQNCLDTGIPIFPAIPFKELGFEFETIL